MATIADVSTINGEAGIVVEETAVVGAQIRLDPPRCRVLGDFLQPSDPCLGEGLFLASHSIETFADCNGDGARHALASG